MESNSEIIEKRVKLRLLLEEKMQNLQIGKNLND